MNSTVTETEKATAKPAKWPDHKVEKRATEIVKPSPNNARLHSEEQVNQIAASIKEWGWTVPILVDETDMIIAGHGRWMAARQLKMKELTVIVARGWTEEQKRAYALADNQLALNSTWDEDLLRIELDSLTDMKFDVALLGFPNVLDDLGFKPDLEPMTAAGQVTAEDIAEASAAAAGEFADKSKQSLVTVLCPHCSAQFTVNKDTM